MEGAGRLLNEIKNTFLAKIQVTKETKIHIFKKIFTPALMFGYEKD